MENKTSDLTTYSKTSFLNTAAAVVNQVVVMIIGFVLPRLYIEVYGSEVNGLVTSITQFISYFTIVEAGLASAGVNALYKPIADKDHEKTNNILLAIKKFYYQVGYIFTGLVFGLAFLYPLFVSIGGFSYWDIAILVIILGANGIIDFFTLSRYRALLTADQKYSVVANANTVAYIVNFAVVFVTIKLGASITVARIAALTLYVVRSAILNIYCRKKYKYITYKGETEKVILDKRWDAMILQILGLAQTAMPVVILTFFADNLNYVSVYSVYNMVGSSVISILFTVTNGFSGSLGVMLAANQKTEFQKVYLNYEFAFSVISSTVYTCMVIMYIPFIKIYTAGITDCEYIYPVTALLFSLNGYFYNVKTPAGTLIGSAGVFKETKTATIIQTAIALGMCLLLVPFLGINGLLIGLIVSNVYRDIDLIIFMNTKVVNVSPWPSFKCCIINSITLIAGIIASYFVDFTAGNLLIWALYSAAVTAGAFLMNMTFNLIFNRKTLFESAGWVRSVFRRGKKA